MAATSASHSWAAFARRAVITGAVAAVGMLALAIPASAHTPGAKAGCDKKTSKPAVSVSAVKYELEAGKPDGKPNSVTVVEMTKDGEKTLVEESFGVNLDDKGFKTYVFDELDGRVGHTFKVTVLAFNDQQFEKGWSKIFKDLKSEICDKTPPSEPSSPPSEPSSPPSEPSSSAPAPQPAPAPAVGADGELAATGASIALPLAIGALLLVGGGVLLLVMRKRGKA